MDCVDIIFRVDQTAVLDVDFHLLRFLLLRARNTTVFAAIGKKRRLGRPCHGVV
jgi:hypothetical protein